MTIDVVPAQSYNFIKIFRHLKRHLAPLTWLVWAPKKFIRLCPGQRKVFCFYLSHRHRRISSRNPVFLFAIPTNVVVVVSLAWCAPFPLQQFLGWHRCPVRGTVGSRELKNNKQSFCELPHNLDESTVKLVYNDHPRDPKFVAVVDRCSLFRGRFMI